MMLNFHNRAGLSSVTFKNVSIWQIFLFLLSCSPSDSLAGVPRFDCVFWEGLFHFKLTFCMFCSPLTNPCIPKIDVYDARREEGDIRKLLATTAVGTQVYTTHNSVLMCPMQECYIVACNAPTSSVI